MAEADLEKSKWLDEARRAAISKGLEFEDGGTYLGFQVKVKEFRKDWIDRRSLDRGILVFQHSERKVHIGLCWFDDPDDRDVSIPYELIPVPFPSLDFRDFEYEWADFVKDKFGYKYDSGSGYWRKRFDDPGEAIEEISRIVAEWVPGLFENLCMTEAVASACIDEINKLTKQGGNSETGGSLSRRDMTYPIVSTEKVEIKIRPEDKGDMTVFLSRVGEKKIQVIKAVREIFDMGLKEAKDLAERAPINMIEGINEQKAEKIKKALEQVGAEIEVRKV